MKAHICASAKAQICAESRRFSLAPTVRKLGFLHPKSPDPMTHARALFLGSARGRARASVDKLAACPSRLHPGAVASARALPPIVGPGARAQPAMITTATIDERPGLACRARAGRRSTKNFHCNRLKLNFRHSSFSASLPSRLWERCGWREYFYGPSITSLPFLRWPAVPRPSKAGPAEGFVARFSLSAHSHSRAVGNPVKRTSMAKCPPGPTRFSGRETASIIHHAGPISAGRDKTVTRPPVSAGRPSRRLHPPRR